MNLGTLTFSDFITFMFQAIGTALKNEYLAITGDGLLATSNSYCTYSTIRRDPKGSDHLSTPENFLI